jgi:RecD/TraA family predicted helicase
MNDFVTQDRESFNYSIQEIKQSSSDLQVNYHKNHITDHRISSHANKVYNHAKWEITQQKKVFYVSNMVIHEKTSILNGMCLQYINESEYVSLSLPNSKDAVNAFFLDFEHNKDIKNILEPIQDDYNTFKNDFLKKFEIIKDFALVFRKQKKSSTEDNHKNITKVIDKIIKSIKQLNTYNEVLYKLCDAKQFQYINKGKLYDLCKYVKDVDTFLEYPFVIKCHSWWKWENFRVLENIALAMNIDMEKRCIAIIERYITETMSEGVRHSCVQRLVVVANSLNRCISEDITQHYVKDIIEKYDGKHFTLVKVKEDNKVKTMVYLQKEYENEISIVNNIVQLINSNNNLCFNKNNLNRYIKEYEDYDTNNSKDGKEFKFNEEQKKTIKSVLDNSFTLMTGPPGSGKSDVVKCICYILTEYCRNIQYDDILLCAPTGKAGSKLQYKNINKYDKDDKNTGEDCIDGITLHSAIWKTRYNDDDDDDDDDDDKMFSMKCGHFKKKIVIVDEVSMMDTKLCELFLRCIKKHDTIVLMIGDHNQLPSIGYGNVLKCLVESKIVVHHIELKEVYRYSDEMKKLANNIKEGKKFKIANSDKIIWCKTNDINNIYQEVFNLYNTNDDKQSIQVIIPTKTKELGCNTFNQFCHDKLKPHNHKSKHFFLGEKIMCTKNINKEGIFNGNTLYAGNPCNDDGIKKFNVFIDKEIYQQWRNDPGNVGKDEVKSIPGNNLGWCYAITIHKSQGSEWDDLVLILNHEYHSNMLNRNLLYTAITRVKKGKLYIYYDSKNVIYDCIKKEFHRDTCLTQLFREVDFKSMNSSY